MSNDNRKARLELERQYGKGCMFKAAKVEDQVEKLKTIKTYKTFLIETRYTGKKIRLLEKNMTFHHLRHRSEGGKATAENGANINELAHRYIHSLPREQEEIINNMFRKYKLQGSILVPTDKGLDIAQPLQLELDFNIDPEDCLIIPVEDNTIEDLRKREKFNRAKVKRDIQREIDDYYDYLDEDER